MSVQFHDPSLPLSSDEDPAPAVQFSLGAQDNRNSLMDADNEVANITEGIHTGVKFAEPSGVKFAEPSGVKFAEPSGVKFAEPSGVKFAEPSGVKFAEPSGVKFAEPSGVKFAEPSGVKFAEPSGVKFAEPSGVKFADLDRQDFEGRKGAKSQELHVTISTPDSAKPQATGSIRRKQNTSIEVPPVS